MEQDRAEPMWTELSRARQRKEEKRRGMESRAEQARKELGMYKRHPMVNSSRRIEGPGLDPDADTPRHPAYHNKGRDQGFSESHVHKVFEKATTH